MFINSSSQHYSTCSCPIIINHCSTYSHSFSCSPQRRYTANCTLPTVQVERNEWGRGREVVLVQSYSRLGQFSAPPGHYMQQQHPPFHFFITFTNTCRDPPLFCLIRGSWEANRMMRLQDVGWVGHNCLLRFRLSLSLYLPPSLSAEELCKKSSQL